MLMWPKGGGERQGRWMIGLDPVSLIFLVKPTLLEDELFVLLLVGHESAYILSYLINRVLNDAIEFTAWIKLSC